MASIDDLLRQLGIGGVARNRAGQIVSNTNDIVPVATAGLADTLYGAGRGTLAGTAAIGGIPGDINQFYVNKFGALYPNEPAPPTSEQISTAVKRAVPPLNLSKDNTGRVATSLGENVVAPITAPESLLSAGTKTAKYAAPVVGKALESYAANTGLLAPLVAYHGTTKPISQLNPKKSFGDLNVSWVSPDPNFAARYAIREGGNIMPLEVNEGKVFDFADPKAIEKLNKKAKTVDIYDPVRGSITLDRLVPNVGESYKSAENPQLFNLIKKMGYDSVAVYEDGTRNLGIFNPKKNIKSKFE